MVSNYPHFLNGGPVATTSSRTSEVFNPALGEVIAHVPLADTDELNKAVTHAKAA